MSVFLLLLTSVFVEEVLITQESFLHLALQVLLIVGAYFGTLKYVSKQEIGTNLIKVDHIKGDEKTSKS